MDGEFCTLPLPRGLGGKEGLKYLMDDVFRNAIAIVFNRDHHFVGFFFSAHTYQRLVASIRFLRLFMHRIERIVDDVQQNPADDHPQTVKENIVGFKRTLAIGNGFIDLENGFGPIARYTMG